jgi:ribonuclease HI
VRSWTEIASLALPYDGTNIATREDIIPTTTPNSALPTYAPKPWADTIPHPSLLIAALPEFKHHWDHDIFTYTDGSKKPSSPLLGAGVFHAPSGTRFVLNASGHDENHTITRAELIAIHFALDRYATEGELHILTDSMCCILKIQAALTRPRNVLYDPHAPLVAAIISALKLRTQNTSLLTSIRKVPAHSGVEGNEIADELANQGADSHSKPIPEVIVCDLGAVPQRPAFWPTYTPPAKRKEEGAPAPAPRHLAYLSHIRKIATPRLTSCLANISLYRSLMVNAMQADGALLSLPAANIQALIAKGERKHDMQLFKFMWGQLYNGKLALRYGHADNDNCPLCGYPDSCTHIGSGCKKQSGLYINRHNAAVRCISNFLST